MKDIPTNTTQLVCLYFSALISWVLNFLVLSLHHMFHPLVIFFSTPSKRVCTNTLKSTSDKTEVTEEVKTVMDRLGLTCYDAQGDDIQGGVGAEEELSRLFDEEEPSLEEVKEAFDVFDENKDGFIDAAELQRVLYILGLEDGFGLDECRRMIEAVDTNGDGLIDFDEFVKHIEDSFC
ncbi:hypothetical protein ACFX2J_011318 [Malus domestica]